MALTLELILRLARAFARGWVTECHRCDGLGLIETEHGVEVECKRCGFVRRELDLK